MPAGSGEAADVLQGWMMRADITPVVVVFVVSGRSGTGMQMHLPDLINSVPLRLGAAECR